MKSHESIEVMAGFAESVDSRELRDALIGALNKNILSKTSNGLWTIPDHIARNGLILKPEINRLGK